MRPANPAFTLSKKHRIARIARHEFVLFPSNGHDVCVTFGGADRDRTDDLKLAKLALSQLSYGPNF